MTGRVPNRVLNMPVKNIATSEPMPRHNSRTPSIPSSTASRSLAYGTSGAQQETPKPATRNASRVATRAAGLSAEDLRRCRSRPGDLESPHQAVFGVHDFAGVRETGLQQDTL